MTEYHYILFFIGFILLISGLMISKISKYMLSIPILMMIFGMALGMFTPLFNTYHPLNQTSFVEYLTEFAVILSLTGAGLKIDRRIGFKRWNITWRLLVFTMPVCILSLYWGGCYFLGLSVAASILLGAVMAPTDPVLASDIQVGPPGDKNEDDVRLSLTSEAGLNDSLAFPFVHLALLAAAYYSGEGKVFDWEHWLSYYVVWKIVGGIVIGYFLGKCIGWLAMKHMNRNVVTESLLMNVIMIFFGISITCSLLDSVGWKEVSIALAFIFLIRPLASRLSLINTQLPVREKWLVGFLGIRGIGSFYYLGYAVTHTENITKAEFIELWGIVGCMVVLSVVIHGLSAPWLMKKHLG